MWRPVVVGILRQRDSKILIGLRPSHAFLGDCWEFPGGKMELGEGPEEALTRELQEELGITEVTLEPFCFSATASHRENSNSILLLFYKIKKWKGTPKPLYHRQLKWVQTKELWELPLLESSKQNLESICEMIKS